VRGMHKWGALDVHLLMFLHMCRVFLFGAYNYPRELNWIIGVLLLVSGLAEWFTGLPAAVGSDSYWARPSGINLNGTAPFLGPFIALSCRAGPYQRRHAQPLLCLSTCCCCRRYRRLIGLHLYLVIALGVTSPPFFEGRAGKGCAPEHRTTFEPVRGPD